MAGVTRVCGFGAKYGGQNVYVSDLSLTGQQAPDLRHAIRLQWSRAVALTAPAEEAASRVPILTLMAFATFAVAMIVNPVAFGWLAIAFGVGAVIRRENVVQGAAIAAMVAVGTGLLLLTVATALNL